MGFEITGQMINWQVHVDTVSKFNVTNIISTTVASKMDWADSRWLYLVNDTLHVGFVRLVSIQERGPLVWCNAQTRFHCYLNYLRVVLPSQSFVSPEFLLQLHQGGILISLGHLVGRNEPNAIKQDKPQIT